MNLKVLGSSGVKFGRYNLPAFLVDRCLLLDAGTVGLAIKEVKQQKIRFLQSEGSIPVEKMGSIEAITP